MENTNVGPFQILKRLGTNRRQKVFHALQTEQGREVALKFIRLPKDIDRAVGFSKIQRETNVLKELKHPNLVQLFGAGAHEDQIFFAYELIDGESLAALLSRRGKLAPDLAIEIGTQIASLLNYLHENEIIHAKLTPEKVIVTRENRVKVSDVRLNRSRRRRWDQPKQHNVELAAYMAPEQFTEGATHKSDLYSLGAMLFEMLTGRLPYPPDTIGRMTRNKQEAPVPGVADHVMNCPIYLDKIVKQMLQPKSRARPHSARAVVLALNEIKKIAHDKKAAVTQVTSGFNPLTVGADKTEANRLLGRKDPKKKAAPSTPFWQGVPFLIGSLVVIAGILIWSLLPVSSDKLMARAEALIEQGELSDARENLKEILDRGSENELTARAETMYWDLRQQTLVQQAENGSIVSFPQNPEARAFCDAVLLQKEQKVDEARSILENLIESVDPEGKNRHVHAASVVRLQQLQEAAPIVEIEPYELLPQIAQTLGAQSAADLAAAEKTLAEIILNYAGESEFLQPVNEAKKNLQIIQQRIASLPDNDEGE